MLFSMMPRRFYEVDESTNCCNWIGPLDRYGRPRIKIFGMYLFRALCWEKHGPPPSDEHHAAHLCHNKICVNPDHSEWQKPETNNPRKPSTIEIDGVGVTIKRRKSSKGGGRIVDGWCAVLRVGGKQYKSGAYYSRESAIRWATNKIRSKLP